MREALRFIGRTIAGGVIFLVPLLLLLVLARESVRLVGKILSPIAKHLPIEPSFGMDKPEIAAAIVLLLIGFLAGLLAQAGVAARLNSAIEQMILRKMPGYTIFKTVVHSAAGLGGDDKDMKVALANIDDAWLIGFIIEHHADGLLTVFIPSAPTPTAGSIYYLNERQIRRLDVPVSAAIKCIMQLGVGSRQLLDAAKFA